MSASLTAPVIEINGYPVKPGMYDELHLPSDDQLREELTRLRDSWTTPEQRIANALRRKLQEECPRCNGRGYTRKDLNAGCAPCRGTGWRDKS